MPACCLMGCTPPPTKPALHFWQGIPTFASICSQFTCYSQIGKSQGVVALAQLFLSVDPAAAGQTISERTIIRKSSLPAAGAPDGRRNCHVSIWTIFTVGGNCLGQDGSRSRQSKKTRAARRSEVGTTLNKWSSDSNTSYFAFICARPEEI